MRKLATLLTTLCLLLALAPAALASGLSGWASHASLGPAPGYINELTKLQNEQKELTGYLNQAQALQAQAKSSGSHTLMPDAMKRYMDQNHLAYDRTGGDALHDKDEWNVAIRSLEARQEKLWTEIQQQMVYIQDFMVQYNAYLHKDDAFPASRGPSTSLAAYAAIRDSRASLSTIARRQSLFSTEGAADMDLPPIATSLLVGVLLGMAAMWGIQRKRPRAAGR